MNAESPPNPTTFVEVGTTPFLRFRALYEQLCAQIVGQPRFTSRLLLALLCDGHLLVEGAPGLAKTKAVKTLAQSIECDFHRIQFTPDLLPADLTGTEVYRPQTGEFEFRAGPLFHNVVLADEINRAPAKVQSALLEAMAERQVTVGSTTYPLPKLFLTMATQNPIEQEGTYPLPEAQLDRFLLHVKVDYPDAASEQQILHMVRAQALEESRCAANPGLEPEPDPNRGSRLVPSRTSRPGFEPLSQSTVFDARCDVLGNYLSPELERYIVALVAATRDPAIFSADLVDTVLLGASPRGSIALDRASRAIAWLDGRDYVTPGDIHAIAHEALRHRMVLGHSAQARGVAVDDIISELLAKVPIP